MLVNAILYCVIIACLLVIVGSILHGADTRKRRDADIRSVREAIRLQYEAEIVALRKQVVVLVDRASHVEEAVAERDRLATTLGFIEQAWDEFQRAKASMDRAHVEESARAIRGAMRRLDELLGVRAAPSQPESGVRARDTTQSRVA